MQRTRGTAEVRLLTLWLAAGVLVLFASDAAAQAIRAAALAPQFKGSSSTPELRDKFHEVVVHALSVMSGPTGPNGELGEILGAGETRARLGDELIGCGGAANCLPRALAALHVNRLVSTELSVVGKSYNISLRLFDNRGRELAHADDLCEICTVREAEEAVGKAVSRLVSTSRSFPIEAVTDAPRTPLPDVAPPRTSTSSPMQESPTPPMLRVVRQQRRYVPWRALAFASLGVGVIGLAVGVPLVVIDGHPTCSASDPAHDCPRLYNTIGGGATMTTLGVIGLAAAIPLFYLDWRDRNRKSDVSLRGSVAPMGNGLALEGRF